MVKSAFTSKTVLTNVAAFAAAFFGIFGLDLTADQRTDLVNGLVLALPVINIVLRFLSDKAIALIWPSTAAAQNAGKVAAVLALLVMAGGLGGCARTGVVTPASASVPASGVVVSNPSMGVVTVLDKADARVAKAATAFAKSCTTLSIVGTGADIYVTSDKGQRIVDDSRAVLDTLCANPPMTVGELLIASGRVVLAVAEVERARAARIVEVATPAPVVAVAAPVVR